MLIDTTGTAHPQGSPNLRQCQVNFAEGCHLYIAATKAPADIVVYDLEKLEILPSEVAEDLPGGEWRRIQKAKGYNWILVNAEITFEDGEPTGALPGRFLRNGRG